MWTALTMTSVLLCAELVFTSPLHCNRNGRKCPMCSAGEYLKTSCKCEPCPGGSYTSKGNCESSCHRCYSDCRSSSYFKVVQQCTRTSNLRCECKKDYNCTERESSGNCRYCQKSHDSTTTVNPPVNWPSPASIQGRTLAQSCNFPNCSSKSSSTDVPESRPDSAKSQLAAILCPLVVIGCIALLILFCVRCPGDDTCFKRTMKKITNVEVKAAAHKPKETSQQFPRDSFCAKQHAVPVAAANLGPVHVHNPGTVIFSLLSQFTGQVGATKVEKTDMDINREDETDSSVCHSPSSPSIPLSEEEHRGETDSIFFPSQEEGKDHCVSKEEEEL